MCKARLRLRAVFDDGNQDVDRDGDPDLGLDRVLQCSIKPFDPKMLLDPLEEQFDLPAIGIQDADHGAGQCHLVGDEDQDLASFRILESNPSQLVWIAATGVKTIDEAWDAATHVQQRLSSIHGYLRVDTRKTARTDDGCPNRHHLKTAGNPRQSWLSALFPSM